MVEDDRRDPSKFGRRDEDERWLRVQEQIMNLITAERTDQQELTAMKSEVVKLADHIEDLDDYLRGVTGNESLDNRVVLLERESTGNTTLLRQIKKEIEGLKTQISDLKIYSAINLGTEEKRSNKLFKFWLPIILAIIAMIIPFTKMACDRAESVANNVEYRPDERLRRQIEADKKSQRGKAVQKKLKELEKIQRSH